jgi:hypothetical protein
VPPARPALLARRPSSEKTASSGPHRARRLAGRASLRTFIVAGDCTDLCTYQLAPAPAPTPRGAGVRVILPAGLRGHL